MGKGLEITPAHRGEHLIWKGLVAALALLPAVWLADRPLQALLSAAAAGPALALLRLGTWLGYGLLDIGIFAALAAIEWGRGERARAVRAASGAAAVAGAGLLSQLLKNLVCRARPSAAAAGALFVDFPCFPAAYPVASFPSGHATTAFAAAVLLSLWYPRGAGIFVGLALVVGLSRVVLGSHFPSDVLAGAVLGSATALVACRLLPALRAAAGAGPPPHDVREGA